MCGLCGGRVGSDRPELCWWCEAELCGACWENVGHCGHPEAEAANRVSRLLPSVESRAYFILTVTEGRS